MYRERLYETDAPPLDAGANSTASWRVGSELAANHRATATGERQAVSEFKRGRAVRRGSSRSLRTSGGHSGHRRYALVDLHENNTSGWLQTKPNSVIVNRLFRTCIDRNAATGGLIVIPSFRSLTASEQSETHVQDSVDRRHNGRGSPRVTCLHHPSRNRRAEHVRCNRPYPTRSRPTARHHSFRASSPIPTAPRRPRFHTIPTGLAQSWPPSLACPPGTARHIPGSLPSGQQAGHPTNKRSGCRRGWRIPILLRLEADSSVS